MEISRTYKKKRREFGKQCFFADSDAEKIADIQPDDEKKKFYIQQNPCHAGVQCSSELSEQRTNTETIELKEASFNHLEGGWGKDVEISDNESKKRTLKRMEGLKEFAPAVKRLAEPVDHFIRQNNALDIYEEYFNNTVVDYFSSTVALAKTVTVFRDPITSFRRTAVDMSWQPADGKKIAVAYGIVQFQTLPGSMPTESYVWDVSNPNVPETKIVPNSPLCCLEYNPKESFSIVGGSYNGVISLFDVRKGPGATLYSQIKHSHKDPVYDIKWIQSKTSTLCLSTSTDGQVIFWDTRNLSEPKEAYYIQVPQDKLEGSTYTSVLGGECLDYDPAYPTKFMVGTEQGTVVSCTRRKNKPIQIDKAHFRHHGPVYAVQRNPFLPKFFLSIGDWTAKIWMEDLSTPIISTSYHSAYLTDGCWSPTRPGVFFTAKQDGTLDIWDLMYKQSKPLLSVNVSDSELHCIRVREGKHLAVGSTDGSTSLVELSESLSGFQGDEKLPIVDERNNVQTMLERETKREKNLIDGKKAAAQQKKTTNTKRIQENLFTIVEEEMQEVVEYFTEQTK